jgi:hypothetical protein
MIYNIKMKRLYKKILENNDSYDDLLGMIVSGNKFKVWSFTIGVLAFTIIIALLVVRDIL